MHSKLTKFSQLSIQRKSSLPHFCLMLLLVCIASLSFGQIAQNYVRLEMKSGIVIEGELVKIKYQHQVDILAKQGDTLSIPWTDIQTLNFIEEEVKERVSYAFKPKKVDVPFNDSGYYFLFDFGVPLGIDYWGDPVAGGTVSFGYGKSFNYKHHLAATIGYDAYLWPDVTVIPVGLEYYGRVQKHSRSLFYFYGMGYSFPHVSEYTWLDNSKVEGRMYFNPGIGVTNKRKSSKSWYLKFGLKYQSLKATYDARVWEFGSQRNARVTEFINYQRFDIRFGWRFD